MNKKKFLIATILTIFLCGMLLASVGAAHAKTVTMYPKLNKEQTKHVGKYKIEVDNWKSPAIQELDVLITKKGNILKFSKYKVKIYYKENGKKKVTRWHRGFAQYGTYYKNNFSPNAKITKVKIKF